MKFLKTIICIFVMFNFCSYIMATQQLTIDELNGYTFKCFCLKQPLQQVQQELKLRELNDEDFTVISFNSEQISGLTRIMQGLRDSKAPWVSVKDLSDMYVASFLKADKENIISLSFLVFAVSCSINLDNRRYKLGREILFDKLFQISDGAGNDVTMEFLGKMSACTDFITRYSATHKKSFDFICQVRSLQSLLTKFQAEKNNESEINFQLTQMKTKELPETDDRKTADLKINSHLNMEQGIIDNMIEYRQYMDEEMLTHIIGAVIFQPLIIPH